MFRVSLKQRQELSGRPASTVVVTCGVLDTEVQHYASEMPHVAHIEYVEQGLHNEPPRLRSRLQDTVDKVEAEHRPEVIVLVYGLCSRGTENVSAQRARMVIPRAHDCITVLLGDRRLYSRYVAEHPGTYWYSPGWNRHHTPPGPERHAALRTEYVERYGEDNADYLMQIEQHWFTAYNRAAYVDLTVGVTDRDLAYTRRCADWLGWTFDHRRGDPQLLIDLLRGPWDDDRFVVLEPGQSLRMTGDERIMEPCYARSRARSDMETLTQEAPVAGVMEGKR